MGTDGPAVPSHIGGQEPVHASLVGRADVAAQASARMTALGILPIAIGVALICAGLIFSLRAPRSDPAAVDGPDRVSDDPRRSEQGRPPR